MTGTGTKVDPFIVTTWSDFLTVIVQSDVYIELGSDITCEDVLSPSDPYTLNYAELDGKNHTIKNIYISGFHYLFEGVKANTTKNLTFKNIYNNGGCFFKFKSDSGDYKYLPTFKNCHFSAECVNEAFFIDNVNTYLYAAVFRDSNFFVLCNNSNFTRHRYGDDIRRPILLDNCHVEIYGDVIDEVIAAQLIDTMVTGEVTINNPDEYSCVTIDNQGSHQYYTTEFMKSNSIIDLIIHNNTNDDTIVYVNGKYYYDEESNTHYVTENLFINTEAIDNYSLRNGSTTFKACTMLQIKNESYLTAQGLIAEQTYSNRYVRKKALITERYGNTVSEPKAYIDTGVKNSTSVKIVSEFEFSSAVSGFAIGGFDSEGYGVAHGSGNGQSIDDISSIWANVKDDFAYGFVGTKFYLYTDGTTWWACQSEQNMIINGQNYAGLQRYGLDGKIYNVKINNSESTLIRNYLPAYDKEEQKYGMYDTVNNHFYASETDTQFPGAETMSFKFVDGAPVHIMSYSVNRIGAFCDATDLEEIRIPPSVTRIGRFAFAKTKLKKVKIASDCVYYDTSFPRDCEIEFYE